MYCIKADEEGNLFICFFVFREEKEIMYGKPFVGFFRDPVNKKTEGFSSILLTIIPFYNTM